MDPASFLLGALAALLVAWIVFAITPLCVRERGRAGLPPGSSRAIVRAARLNRADLRHMRPIRGLDPRDQLPRPLHDFDKESHG